MSTLYLCGAGNSEGVRLALRINQKQARWNRIVVVDDDEAKHGRTILGIDIVGSFDMLGQADPGSSEVANLVARTTVKRFSARRKIQSYGLPFATMIDPDVDVSGAEFARDVVVYQHAIVGPEVWVDEGSVILTSFCANVKG